MKFEMVRLGSGSNIRRLARILGCKIVNLPIMYLGKLLGANDTDVKTWDSVVARFERRLARWKINLLSKSDCLTLIKRILANLPIYYMSLLSILKSFAKKLELFL